MPQSDASAGASRLDRPFYFIVSFWGEEYRRLFTTLCLPSLLAPGNIPALVNKADARFVMACTRTDWDALQGSPLMGLLRRHIEPVFVEIPDPQPGDDKFRIMTHSHRIAADMAIAAKAYGSYLCPDGMLSDGSVATLQRMVAEGAKVVLGSALRHVQETFLPALAAHPGVRPNEPIALTPRDLMRLSLAHLHPQAVVRDWDAERFSITPGFCLWRAPRSDDIILHNTRWAPLVLSYGELAVHEAQSNYAGSDHIAVDDDYVYRNFGDDEMIRVIDDSDLLTYVSVTPREISGDEPTTHGVRRKRICLRVNAFSGIMDPLQWRLFRVHVRLHAGDITPAWRARERAIDALLDNCLSRPPTEREKQQVVLFDVDWTRERQIRILKLGPLQKLRAKLGLHARRILDAWCRLRRRPPPAPAAAVRRQRPRSDGGRGRAWRPPRRTPPRARRRGVPPCCTSRGSGYRDGTPG